ncbi:hypothetical protein HMPREF1311_03738 [Proteus mirabilis WGLW6]|nr:hypothetical protein HMPREF1311_03738 [Proteus mirabilis WGLW6]
MIEFMSLRTSAEFNGVEDETEDLHLYLDRFAAFQ